MPSMKLITLAALSTLAAAGPIEIRNAPIDTLLPTTLSQWNSGTSSVNFNTGLGQAQRSRGQWTETSTLLSFNIPSKYNANKCALVFTNPTNAGGSQQAQIFFDTRPATAGAQSNFRDNQIGNLKATPGADAVLTTVDGRDPQTALAIDCAKLIAQPNLEVTPRGEDSYIYWTAGNGLKVLVYPAGI